MKCEEKNFKFNISFIDRNKDHRTSKIQQIGLQVCNSFIQLIQLVSTSIK
jgi:hypothetical protein